MTTLPLPTSVAAIDPRSDARALRRRSVANLLRMGHCAPTVMQTLLDASATDAPWLVKLTAGLPGGIGNTGGECGGVTAPLILLGLRYGRQPDADGLPIIVAKGLELLRRFGSMKGTISCREIRGEARVPLKCIGVVRDAPELCAQCLHSDCDGSVPVAEREAYARLYAHWAAERFHCTQSVFRHLAARHPVDEQVLAAGSGFMGGTVFTGRTCGALTAGVMALGLKLGEIENSRLRVIHMIAMMAVGGDAFADDVNAFNKSMNLGHELSLWFAAEFGGTQCRGITQCDFRTTDGVERYMNGGQCARCEEIARTVATRVAMMIDQVDVGERKSSH